MFLMQPKWPICIAICLGLSWGCGPGAKEGPDADAWEGDDAQFASHFKVLNGWICSADGQPHSGTLTVRRQAHVTYFMKLEKGRPLVFQNGEQKAVARWTAPGLWVGVDSAWEQDFDERAEGLVFRKSGNPFSGKIISIHERTGAIQVEYNYLNGVSHGPEIYFDENQNESSRQTWVNGKIPVGRL
tara:strand:- start:374 stop:931 length:558 start_codon:yes stop_codon:yes gene_type:complete